MNYKEAKQALYALPMFGGELSLDPITELMAALDDPQDEYATIHVAGTNGKGSTSTMIAAMLRAAGYRTGLYTSPHLTDVRERVRVNGEAIRPRAFVDCIAAIQATDCEVSFFECTTAIAFKQFADRDVDVAVIETGLGGRFDATNIIRPRVSVITNVARDHTRWLGEDVEAIAREKAGIIKDETPVVSGVAGTAARVVRETAERRSAPMYGVRDMVSFADRTQDGIRVAWKKDAIQTRLHGRYQVANLNTAVTAVQVLDVFDVADDAIRSTLQTVTVPGRMERVSQRPAVYLDGAHNPAGMRTAVETYRGVATSPVVAVVSVMRDKAYEPMLEMISGFADHVVLSTAAIARAADPDVLAEAVSIPCTVEPDRFTALQTAQEVAGETGSVFVTGSLYFVGDMKAVLTRSPGLVDREP